MAIEIAQTIYDRYTSRIKAAHEQLLADTKDKWRETVPEGSNGASSTSLNSRFTDFLAMLENQLGGDETTEHLRDGQEGYARAGNTNVIISDAGKYYVHGGGRGGVTNTILAHNNALIASGNGNNRVEAYNNAFIAAGSGHDAILTNNNASVNLGSGNDYAHGNANSRISGGAGDDIISGRKNAQLFGGAGDDHLSSHNNAMVDGGAGNDRIFAGNNSIAQGGTGDDYIRMGDNTVALFNKGDGWDVLQAMPRSSIGSGTLNKGRVVFGPDISVTDMDIVKRGPHLVISIKGTQDAVVIRNVEKNKIPTLEFTDGSILSEADVVAVTRIDDSPLDERLKTAGNKKMLGSSGDDNLSHMLHSEVWAGAGNDTIRVAGESTVHFGRGGGNDVLIGFLSWRLSDTVEGSKMGKGLTGSESLFEGVEIFDPSKASGTLDTSRVLFDADVTPDDVTFTFEGNNLVIGIKGSNDTLTIPDMGRIDDPSHFRPDQIAPNLEFADGTYWTSAMVMTKAETSSA